MKGETENARVVQSPLLRSLSSEPDILFPLQWSQDTFKTIVPLGPTIARNETEKALIQWTVYIQILGKGCFSTC